MTLHLTMATLSNVKLVKQDATIDIKNIDDLTVDSVDKDSSKHGELFPNSVRCIITGPSGSGKTNVLFNLLTSKNGLRFQNLYIFSKTLSQGKYQLLERILNNVPEVSYFKFNANDDIIQPNEAKPFSIFVFDDVALENHDAIRNYFAMGRHNNIDLIYIGQTYSKIPKQLIRDNVNLIIVFKQDETNLKHIHAEHVGTDLPWDEFKKLCSKVWVNTFDFLVIAKERPINNGRYRMGFDKFIVLQ